MHPTWAATRTFPSALWLSTPHTGAGFGRSLWCLYGTQQGTRSSGLQEVSSTVVVHRSRQVPGLFHWWILSISVGWRSRWSHNFLWAAIEESSTTRRLPRDVETSVGLLGKQITSWLKIPSPWPYASGALDVESHLQYQGLALSTTVQVDGKRVQRATAS